MDKKATSNRLIDSTIRLKWILVFSYILTPLIAFNIGLRWESTLEVWANTSYYIIGGFLVLWMAVLFFINEGLTAMIGTIIQYKEHVEHADELFDSLMDNSKDMLEHIHELEAQLSDDKVLPIDPKKSEKPTETKPS